MKRVGLVMAILAMTLTSGASWALPAVQLENSCGYVFSPGTGFDAQQQLFYSVLSLLSVSGLPTSWDKLDLEGVFVGDGLPDTFQLGLLGAALCDGDTALLAQYNGNVTAWHGFMTAFQNAFNSAYAEATPMASTATDLAAWANALPAGPPYDDIKAQALTIAGALSAAATSITDFVTQYGSYIPTLDSLAPMFGGMAGLSTEMKSTFEALINVQLLGGLTDTITDMQTLALYCATLAGTVPAPPMTPDLAAALTARATELNGVAALMAALTYPSMSIYGMVKAAGEPFSALGDYNGNGDTNQQVYQAYSSDRPGFVAAASGAFPWYSGNPALPVAGVFGLMMLAGALTAAAARTIKK